MNKSNLKRKLLLLEVNEIPWRIIDKFTNEPSLKNIRKFFLCAKTYTTKINPKTSFSSEAKLVRGISSKGKSVVIDSGELSPWVTWPTFHRGLESTEHNIKFLGQDITTFKGRPIWQDFIDNGYSVGICGSMQSWPPVNPGIGGFYIPDTFAHDQRCIPEYIEPFQRFNLSQVQKNGLVVRQKGIFGRDLVRFLLSLPRLGITINTLSRILNQLIMESFNKDYLANRPIFQGVILWDIFKSLYDVKSPPALSTFFTNHVASIMHRYWNDIFPEDFKNVCLNKSKSYSNTIFFALKVLDEILSDVIEFCEINPEITIVFVTSMGQDAINYNLYEGYSAELEDVSKLLTFFGINQNDFIPLLAMVPQVTVQIKNPDVRKLLDKKIACCYTSSGKNLFSFEEAGNTVSITINNPTKDDALHGGFVFSNGKNGKLNVSWDKAGIIIHDLEVATAYHISEGVMAIYSKNIKPDDSREEISLSKCKSLLMDLAFN